MTSCKLCGSQFSIDEFDRRLLGKLTPRFADRDFPVPEPKHCPECRTIHRYLWRGELHLYKTKSVLSGKDLISFYPPGSPVKVADNDEWWGEGWDPFDYGREIDFSRPFLEQVKELLQEVPIPARCVEQGQENCDYINCASWNRNCYLLAGANHDEDCLYGNYVNNCKNCVDCNFVTDCELCYECVDCTHCYNLRYSTNSHGCSESYWLANCRNCQECFGCVNLVGKQYHFFNEQLSKGEYHSKVAELNVSRRSTVTELWERFERQRLKFPHRYWLGEHNENCTGNSVHHSKNTFDCFDVTNCEDCRYCHWFHQGKDCSDIIAWGFPAELCYYTVEAGDRAYRLLFCVSCYSSKESLYSIYSHNCSHVFGCVGLKRAEHCILNRQYTPKEYEKTAASLVEHMQETGEWGNFFPISMAPLPYNTSIAMDYFPVDAETAQALGARWYEEPDILGPPSMTELPEEIRDVPDSICKTVLKCSLSGKSYKITKAELDFYRRQNLPLPDLCFQERHKRRLGKRPPRKLWDRECTQCGKQLCTPYAPDQPEIIVCDDCYQQALYQLSV